VKSKKTATQKLFWIRRKRKFSMMKAIQSCTRIGQNPARPENKILLPEKLPNEVKKVSSLHRQHRPGMNQTSRQKI
jgi:hypothetical protein